MRKPLGYINTDSGFTSTTERLKNRLANMSTEEKREAKRRLLEFCEIETPNQ